MPFLRALHCSVLSEFVFRRVEEAIKQRAMA